MSAPPTTTAEFTLLLTQEERAQLSSLLDQALRDKRIEVHRTDAIEYRKQVQQEETVLQGLVEKLRRA
jgi:hypothetical protein